MGYTIGPTLAVQGEPEYVAAMKRVRESMTYVKAEANAAISVFGKNEKSVESLTAQINSAKKALDVQKQAVKAAEDALGRMRSNGVDESSTAYKRMEANLNNAKAAMNATQKEIEEHEQELKEAVAAAQNMASAESKAGNEARQMGKDLKNASGETQSFKQQIKDFATSSVGQFASIAGAVALAKEALQALWEMIDNATNAADELLTLSEQTGLAVDTLQEMQYAARFIDVELDQMTSGLSKTVKSIREANAAGKDYIEIGDGLTVSIKDQNGQLRASEDVFYDVIDAIGKLSNETEREAAAQQIFGKSYQDIMPLVKAGSGAIKEYGKEAKETGKTIDTITVMALGKLDDVLEEVAATSDATSKKTAASMIRIADFGAKAWEKVLQNLDPIKGKMDQAIAFTALWTGQTVENVRAQVDLATAIDNVSYITGLTTEQVKAQADALSQYLMVQDATKSSTDAYNEALVYVAQGMDAVAIAQQKMSKAQATANEAINAAADAYVAKWTEYQQAVKATAENYASDLGGLFEAFDAGLAGSQAELDKMSETLLGNLRSQVDGIKGWASEIEELAKRGIDQGLLQELRDMGPEAYAQIQALNNMTDGQLQEYSRLYRQMGTEVTNAAKDANKDLARETEKALQAANVQANNQTVKMKALGVQLGKGLGDGMNLSSSYMTTRLQSAIDKAIANVKRKYGIQSPSKLMRDEVGKYLGEGMGVGWIDSIKALAPKINDAMHSLASRLSDSIPRSINTTSTPTATSITREIIRDSGFQPQFNGPVYINNDMDIKTLAEKLGYYYRQTLAAQGI